EGEFAEIQKQVAGDDFVSGRNLIGDLQRGAERLFAGPGVVAELRALASGMLLIFGAGGTELAVVRELQADRVALGLEPGEADVAIFAGPGIFANFHAEVGQLGIEFLIGSYPQAVFAAISLPLVGDRAAVAFVEHLDELFVVLKNLLGLLLLG